MNGRRKWTAAEKLRIVLAGLEKNIEIADLCRREGISATQFYGWKKQLLGAAPDQVPDLAKLASPIFHVDRKSPPILLMHGDQDTQMPLNQVDEMQWAYEQAGLHAEVLILHGVDHDAVPFFKDQPVERAVKFLKHAID